MRNLPVLLKDGYKVGHPAQYNKNTTLIYSNLTPRKSRDASVKAVLAWAFQYFVLEYLIKQFDTNFFVRDKDQVLKQYKRRVDNYLGPGTNIDHIAALHELQYLPLKVKAVPEGTLVPFRVPVMTIRNTKPDFFWLTNMLETLLSNVLWLPMTSATTAFEYKRTFERYARETGAAKEFVPWQGHDFSFRGMAGIEAACLSGAGHLLSFTGTDTIPAIDFLEEYYGADCEKELIGGSVPATEHSVMSMGLKDGERETIKRLLIEVYPIAPVLSIVWDTWDFWGGVTKTLPALKDVIMGRPGKLVIRPDSGDPVKIICGDPLEQNDKAIFQGAIETLWNIFGGTINKAGYKELDPHIGLIYGDSITRERQEEILGKLKAKRFASSSVVLGIGSYTYQHVTRDTFGFAMKATYGERRFESGPEDLYEIEGQAIYKEPKTDDGTKNSAKGLLAVFEAGDVGVVYSPPDPSRLYCKEECDWKQEGRGILQTIFEDGKAQNIQTLAQIRARVESQL